MDIKPIALGIAFASVAFIFFSQKRMNEKLRSHDIDIRELYDHFITQQQLIDRLTKRISSVNHKVEAQRDRLDRINTLVWDSIT